MLLRVPDDVLRLIADLLEDPALAVLCRRTHRLLRWHYVHWHVTRATAGPQLARMAGASIRTLRLTCGPPGDTDPTLRWVEDLRHTAVHHLTLEADGAEAPHPHGPEKRSVRALQALRHVPQLRSLDVRLWGAGIGDEGAGALAALYSAPQLTTLSLDLSGNSIGPSGASALAALRRAPLQALTLNLWFNPVGTPGARSLATLASSCPTLRALHLSMGYCSLGDAGAAELARIGDSESLRTITLSLPGNHIGDAGAAALTAGLCRAPNLTALHLVLANNCVGDGGVACLCTGLRSVPSLRHLTLDAQLIPMGPAGRQMLADLPRGPTLGGAILT
jgi:hypothetical protein